MLAVFFTIVFVAELIVAGWIISAIKKLIVQVEQINLSVNQISPEIISTVTQVRAIAEMISSKLDATKNFIGDTKNDCICGIKKTLITFAISICVICICICVTYCYTSPAGFCRHWFCYVVWWRRYCYRCCFNVEKTIKNSKKIMPVIENLA